MMKYDLHCHSTYSDGSLTPTELVELAKKRELSGLSITDHDTFHGYFEAINQGLDIIPGVEISAEFESKSIHVLAYAFDPRDPVFYDFCKTQRTRRLKRNLQMCQLLANHGMPLDESDIMATSDENHTYGRVHIALALVKKGYVTDLLDAFKRFIGGKGPCYVSGEKWSVAETIEAIHKAKGFAVLAHPHLIDSRALVHKLLELPFDGLEAYYSRFQLNVNERWVRLAQDKGLFVTGGSDFHGLPKPEVLLGQAVTPQAVFDQLKSHFYGLSRLS